MRCLKSQLHNRVTYSITYSHIHIFTSYIFTSYSVEISQKSVFSCHFTQRLRLLRNRIRQSGTKVSSIVVLHIQYGVVLHIRLWSWLLRNLIILCLCFLVFFGVFFTKSQLHSRIFNTTEFNIFNSDFWEIASDRVGQKQHQYCLTWFLKSLSRCVKWQERTDFWEISTE